MIPSLTGKINENDTLIVAKAKMMCYFYGVSIFFEHPKRKRTKKRKQVNIKCCKNKLCVV